VPQAPFQPPEPVPYRASDVVDTFASYKYRNTCNISSLDLHAPFAPLCQDRQSLLTAMSSGGRIGNDAPYMPRGCDMRWFSTEEICEVLRRFSRVVIVGDSMMRHLAGSINVLLRKDLGYGAVKTGILVFRRGESIPFQFLIQNWKLDANNQACALGKIASAITNSMSNRAQCKASTRLRTLPNTILTA
jgi:hypothetical protein